MGRRIQSVTGRGRLGKWTLEKKYSHLQEERVKWGGVSDERKKKLRGMIAQTQTDSGKRRRKATERVSESRKHRAWNLVDRTEV